MLTLVKLGGSLITDKSRPFVARERAIKMLAREIFEARRESGLKIILGHGGGSYPHKPAKDYQTHLGAINQQSWKGFSIVQDAAARLNRIVLKALVEAGETAVSVQPSSGCLAESGRIVKWDTEPIERMLSSGLLPVVYGDVGLDLKQGMCILSTEEVLGFLARKLGGTRLILCGKVPGVLVDEKIVPEITPENFDEIREHLAGSDGIDVTGGMLQKIEQSLELAKLGIQVQVMSGDRPDFLKRTILGEKMPGTIIRA